MTLTHDKSTAAKMVACAELIRRLEHKGIEPVLSETVAVLNSDDPAPAVTTYIGLNVDGPVEYDVIEHDPRREDDVHPDAFAFAVTIQNNPDLTQSAINAAHDRLAGLVRIHAEEL